MRRARSSALALPRRTQTQLIRISADHVCHDRIKVHFRTVGLRRVFLYVSEKSLICLGFR